MHHRDPRAVFAMGAWIPTAVVLAGAYAWFGLAAGGDFLRRNRRSGFAVYEYRPLPDSFRDALRYAVEARLRARHLAHHAARPDAIFGVTTPIWDVVFGTEPEPERMRELAAAGARVAPLVGPSNLGQRDPQPYCCILIRRPLD